MNNLEIEKQKEFMEKVNKILQEVQHFYYLFTMGCSLNENDSEKIAGMANKMGYQRTEELEKADLILFNTCCVRENAEEKLFGKLGQVKKQKEESGAIISVCGCMMQEKHMVEKIQKSYPFVDIIFGTHTLHRFPESLYQALQNKKIEDILDISGEVYENLPIERADKNKAQVTIMYGCNNFCSYCIVPYVRGRERSRKKEDILKEIEVLAEQGYQEVTLLGQNVNSYMRSEMSKAQGEKYLFSHLLKDVNKINGIERVKFLSPHPKDFTDDVIAAIRDCRKVSKQIHLPLQSGSSKILEKMNRSYTKEEYLQLVEKMKDQIPDVSLSTDIIVGFPGETEEDFQDTLDVVQKVEFEQVYMFIYSRRKGTAADQMQNQIPEDVKHERFDRLKKLAEDNIQKSNQTYIGKTVKILVEGSSKSNTDMLAGRTHTNKIVVFKGDKAQIGKMVDVKIISEHMWYLRGEI